MGDLVDKLDAVLTDMDASTVSSVVAFGLAMAYAEPSWWGTMQRYLGNVRVVGQQ